MLPLTHARVIERAATLADAPLVDELVRGSYDEDRYIWPIVGWRTPAIGFTHSYRGELGFPSARSCCERLVERARRVRVRDPRAAAWLLGRACHLLTDVGVPARVQGVWHYFGDPMERWVDDHLDELVALPLPDDPPARGPGPLADHLAAIAAPFPVDRTRTFEGRALAFFGRRHPLATDQLVEQARTLLPQAIAHVRALLTAETRSG